MVLHEMGVNYAQVEVDRFSGGSAGEVTSHLFGRVPGLVHGAFTIYETAAIGRYGDPGFDGPALTGRL